MRLYKVKNTKENWNDIKIINGVIEEVTDYSKYTNIIVHKSFADVGFCFLSSSDTEILFDIDFNNYYKTNYKTNLLEPFVELDILSNKIKSDIREKKLNSILCY